MSLKDRVYQVIFEAETPAGRYFDIVLLWAIVISVIAVCLESVTFIAQEYGYYLRILEWMVTAFFTVEYILRVYSVKTKRNYIFSYYGLIDLMSILPAYLSLVFVGTHSLAVIRALRLLRIFRIFKLRRYIGEAGMLKKALMASLPKIIVFLSVVGTLTVIFGSIMYLVEGPENGFTSIPRGMYWTIVTMTTVGYGDISPHTNLGQFLASILMICGYGIIAIPTGIVAGEMAMVHQPARLTTKCCSNCSKEGHADDSIYCKYCGEKF